LELFAFCVRKSGGKGLFVFQPRNFFRQGVAGQKNEKEEDSSCSPNSREGVLTQKKKKAPNTETNT
jgi:hypothetical protein